MADPDIKKVVDQVKAEVKDDVADVVKEIVDEAVKDKEELKVEAVSWYNKLPVWGQLLFLASLFAGYIAYEKWVAVPNTAPVVINVAPAAVTPPTAINSTVDAAAAARLDTARLFAKILRNQTVKQLQSEGLKSATGENKPLSKAEATALVDNLDDDNLVAAAQIVLPTEGRFLDTIGSLLKWLIENKETLKKIIEMIILLLSAFA